MSALKCSSTGCSNLTRAKCETCSQLVCDTCSKIVRVGIPPFPYPNRWTEYVASEQHYYTLSAEDKLAMFATSVCIFNDARIHQWEDKRLEYTNAHKH